MPEHQGALRADQVTGTLERFDESLNRKDSPFV